MKLSLAPVLALALSAGSALAELHITQLKFSISTPDSDVIRSDTLTPNATILPSLSLSAADTFKLSFTVENDQGEGVQPVQSMLRFQAEDGGEDVLLPFKVSPSGKGRFELNMRRPPPLLPPTPTPTPLLVSLILALPPNTPLQLPLFHLSLPLTEPLPPHPEEHLYHPQPELFHTFRPEERVPPRIISALSAGAVLAPWVILIYLLSTPSLRPSLPFASSPPLLLFLVALAAFEGLLVTYWVELTLGQVLMYASVLGLGTVVVGVKGLNARRFAL